MITNRILLPLSIVAMKENKSITGYYPGPLIKPSINPQPLKRGIGTTNFQMAYFTIFRLDGGIPYEVQKA
jgi:hypothetical protein